MNNSRRRRLIACEAARLLADRRETDFQAARIAAARRVVGGAYVPESELPSNAEISEQLVHLSGATQRSEGDRFELFRALLVPLESVKLSPERHPEGDAQYQSLQVLHLARQEIT